MEQIKNLFGASVDGRLPSRRNIRSERDELISFFLFEINKGRRGTKYRMATARQIAVILSIYTIAELYCLKSKCVDAERRKIPFGAAFWSEIKVKPGLGGTVETR